MDNIILTDMDGVTLDWETPFHKYMQSRGHIKAHERPSYWQETYYPDLSEERAREMVYHFNTSAWMMDLPAFRDARGGVARLVDEGYMFTGLTAMGTDPYSLLARNYNVDAVFGKQAFNDVIATDMYDPDSKRAELTRLFKPGRFWIEDKPANAVLGREIGYETLLITHPHNEEFDCEANDIKRVNSWSDICEVILDTHY